MADNPGRPGLESDHIPRDRRSVVAWVDDVPTARRLMEDLEAHGVPPGSIALGGAVPPEDDAAHADMPESSAIVDVTRAMVVGAVIGAVLGAGVGAAITALLTGLSLFWGVALGAVFGGGIGLAGGGMAVAKFNSPAWRETYETVEWEDSVAVGVHDQGSEILEVAEDVMERSQPLAIRRLDDGA
ncbi:MAG: hypothetical protein ACLFWM_04985 [Actinomycetota bacterium]